MTDYYSKPLFIFDMANNHQGNLEHGLRIIREVHEACKGFDFNFGFKFQYRDLDTFIHPEYKGRQDIKYVKRFSETRISGEDYLKMKQEAEKLGFISVCTPFDENSVALIEKHGFNILKVASCSFTDWPLLERISKSDKPIIASTAGANLDDIDKVVSFFEHRNKNISLMHCVAEYPTADKNLQLNQIDLLRTRYAKVPVGYSTHESPDNTTSVKIAIAKGARILEKHVGIKTDTISLNAYSATPAHVKLWLASAKEAYTMCGVVGERYKFLEAELKDLSGLRRGVFTKADIKKGDKIDASKVFYAIPTVDGQITANEMSKYNEYSATKDISANRPVMINETSKLEIREKIYQIVTEVKKLIKASNVVVPNKIDFEISYQYGLDKFEKFGGTIINFINRDYCKKLIISLPGQTHPEQYHKLKEETFNIIYGKVLMKLDGVEKEYGPGDSVLVEKGVRHEFSTKTGAVIEEISSTHYKEDSYYTDPSIAQTKSRKTYLTYWIE
jgi:sialic acid synthase SpsE/mannose-6-phosphate isomerase-like protein (cupin superfamily)